MFNCRDCDKKLQKKRGCISPIKKGAVWRIDECIFCFGENRKCVYCKGKGKIFVERCPHSLYKQISFLLPYYLDYRADRSLWPNGKSRMYQPIKLWKSFDVLDYYFNKYEADNIKKLGQK